MELISASDLPNFVANLSRQYISFVPENRIAILLTDPEAFVQFYLCAGKKHKKLLDSEMEEF